MNKVSIDVPPYEINGNGKPFTGIIPETIAQLTKIWDKNIDDIPIKIKPENLSEAFNDRLRIRYMKILINT